MSFSGIVWAHFYASNRQFKWFPIRNISFSFPFARVQRNGNKQNHTLRVLHSSIVWICTLWHKKDSQPNQIASNDSGEIQSDVVHIQCNIVDFIGCPYQLWPVFWCNVVISDSVSGRRRRRKVNIEMQSVFHCWNKMNYKLVKHLNLLNRLKTPISRVVTGFDVNVLVGSCLIGMLSSVYGLRNTQQMNASLNKVKIEFFDPIFFFVLFFQFLRCQREIWENFLEGIILIKILQADQKLTGLCASIPVHTTCSRRLLTTFVSIVYVYIGSMLGKHFHLQSSVRALSPPNCMCVRGKEEGQWETFTWNSTENRFI